MVERKGLRGAAAAAALIDYYGKMPEGTPFAMMAGYRREAPDEAVIVIELGEEIVGFTVAEAVALADAIENAATMKPAWQRIYRDGGYSHLATALRSGAAKLEAQSGTKH